MTPDEEQTSDDISKGNRDSGFDIHMLTQVTFVGVFVKAAVIRPAGIKYMFAIECSRPEETKAMNREPDTEELTDQVISTDTKENGKVHEPVAANSLEEC